LRGVGGDAGRVGREGEYFAVDTGLAQAAGDELGDLAAEIQDENAVVVCCVFHGHRQHKRPRVGKSGGGRAGGGAETGVP